MMPFLRALPIGATVKMLAFAALALLIYGMYQNHQDLKAEVIAQRTLIGMFEQAQIQAKQVNDDNQAVISQLELEIVAQQKLQAAHEEALSIARANQATTHQELDALRANNEQVKKWLDTGHGVDISGLLNNARARYTNGSQERNNKASAASALSNPR